jgi:hypothetical protein
MRPQMQLMGFAKTISPLSVRRLLRPTVSRILGQSSPWEKNDTALYVGTNEISRQL